MTTEQKIADLKLRLNLPSLPDSAKAKIREMIASLEASSDDGKQEKIADLKKRLALPSLPESAKAKLREMLEKLEGETKKAEPAKSEEKPVAKKPVAKKPVAKKPTEAKEPKVKFVKKPKEKKSEEPIPMETKKTPKKRGRKPSAAKKPVTQEPKVQKKRGRKPKKKETPALKTRVKKTYKPTIKVEKGEPDCDTLLKQFRARRAKAKASQKKRKTTPVFRKIASDVVDAVEKAIKNVPAKQIKESPKVMIRKFGNLQKAADGFLKAFRDILGKDYNTGQAQMEINDLKKLIEKLVKKYSVK